jgi:NAD(P)H-hydrate epimerase
MTYFTADHGVKVPAISTAEMRGVDSVAVDAGTPNLFQMMENGGRALASHAVDRLGADWRQVPIAVLAGGGGNGGGGICAARHLANHGAKVVLVVPEGTWLGSAAGQQLEIYRRTRGEEGDMGCEEWGLIIDALVGYGLSGPARGPKGELIEAANRLGAPVISLDVPSGLDATTGEATGAVIDADSTVTLALPKTGLMSDHAGELWLADIGIPIEVFAQAGIHLPGPVFDGRHLIRLHRAEAPSPRV